MNQAYGTVPQKIGTGLLDLSAGNYKLAAVSSAYTPDLGVSGDSVLDDLTGILSTGTITTPTFLLGVFDADNFVANFPDPGSGNTAVALVLYKDTGLSSTSDLIAYIDTAAGLPIVGDDVADTITWDAQGIFAFTVT